MQKYLICNSFNFLEMGKFKFLKFSLKGWGWDSEFFHKREGLVKKGCITNAS